MKKILSMLLVLTMLFSLAACGGTAEESEAPAPVQSEETAPAEEEAPAAETEADTAGGEKTVLKISNYAILESNYTAFWEGVEAGFEEAYPEYDIEWVTSEYSQTTTNVLTAAGAGDYCDAIFGEHSWISTLAYAFEPATSVLNEEVIGEFDSTILDSCVFDGECYAVPYYVSPFILYYNTQLFEEAGITEVPTTFEELEAACEKLAGLKSPITGNAVVPFGQTTASVAISGTSLTAFIYNFGGDVMTPEGKMSVDNDGFTQAMTTLKNLYDKGYMTENQKLKDLRQSYANGELAMYYDQAWGFSGVSGINPDAASFTASAPAMSGGSGTGQSVLNAAVFMVSNKNGNADGVNKFISYVTSDEELGYYLSDIAAAWSAKTSQADMEVQAVLAGATGSQSNLKAVPMIETLNDLNLELCTLAQNITLNGMSVDDGIAAFKNSTVYQTIGE
ncbi:MAG: extracellular solute-binding protein [Lachnospiraceae bacterium]|nr:extracellular solute-binding protein [Lachnospiraceae bacterium]